MKVVWMCGEVRGIFQYWDRGTIKDQLLFLISPELEVINKEVTTYVFNGSLLTESGGGSWGTWCQRLEYMEIKHENTGRGRS